jgi:hypothetical protein
LAPLVGMESVQVQLTITTVMHKNSLLRITLGLGNTLLSALCRVFGQVPEASCPGLSLRHRDPIDLRWRRMIPAA